MFAIIVLGGNFIKIKNKNYKLAKLFFYIRNVFILKIAFSYVHCVEVHRHARENLGGVAKKLRMVMHVIFDGAAYLFSTKSGDELAEDKNVCFF